MKQSIFDLQMFGAIKKITNSSDNIVVKGTSGADNITNSGKNVKINCGAGSDFVDNEGEFITINGGTERDELLNTASNVVINGEAGNDVLGNYHESYVTINGGEGNDFIDNSGTFVTINGGAGVDSILNSPGGSDMIADCGAGNDKVSIYAGENITVSGGEGNDYFLNRGEKVSISGDSGADTVTNSGQNNTIDGGDGNDFVTDTGGDVIIFGGDGKDSISSTGIDTTMIGGAGDDYIHQGAFAFNSTISGGTGDDIISLDESSAYSVIQYAAGDGDDTIFGFDSDDVLRIAADDYEAFSDNGDIIIKVGYGSVRLVNVKKAKIVKVKTSAETSQLDWKISGTTATGKLNGKIIATVTGLKKGTTAQDISVVENAVLLNKNALDTATVKITGDYRLALADDANKSVTTPAGWNISDGTAIYKTTDKTAGHILSNDKKSITYTKAVASKNLTTITGLKSGVTADDLTLNGKNVTLSKNALGTDTVKISGAYNLVLGSDVVQSKTTKAAWNISGTDATYTAKKISEGYVLASNKKSVSFNQESGGEVIEITGLKSGATAKNFSVKNNVITLSKKVLTADSTVNLTGDYKLALGADVKKSSTTKAHWQIIGTTAKYIAEKTSAGYKLSEDKKSVDYTSASGGNVLATVTGLKKGVRASQLSINTEDNVITLSKNALATTSVKVSGDYTLKLADDVVAPQTTDAHFTVSGTTAKYLSEKTTAGYTLSEDKKSVKYSKVKGGTALATIGGLKTGTTADNFSVKNNMIKVAKDVGGKNGLTVNGKGYSFNITPPCKVTGSKGNDTIGSGAVSGETVYISGGDGNDWLSASLGGKATLLGGNGNDTLVGGGDDILTGGAGNDVFSWHVGFSKNTTVTDYTSGKDRIYWASSLDSELIDLNTFNVNGKDVVIPSLGNMTIKNAAGKKITFFDNDGKTVVKTFTAADSSNLFEENNFISSDNLSDIVESEISLAEFGHEENKISQENLITFAK